LKLFIGATTSIEMAYSRERQIFVGMRLLVGCFDFQISSHCSSVIEKSLALLFKYY